MKSTKRFQTNQLDVPFPIDLIISTPSNTECFAVTTFMTQYRAKHYEFPSPIPEYSIAMSAVIPSGILLPLTCSKRGETYAPFRSDLATAMLKQLRYTRMSSDNTVQARQVLWIV